MPWGLTYDSHLGLMRGLLKPSDPKFCGNMFSPQERSVLLALLVHERDGKCWPGLGTLVKGTGLSRSTVLRALDELEGMEVISRKRGVRGATTVYTMNLLASVSQALVSEGNQCHPEPSVSRNGGSVRETPKLLPTTEPLLSVKEEEKVYGNGTYTRA